MSLSWARGHFFSTPFAGRLVELLGLDGLQRESPRASTHAPRAGAPRSTALHRFDHADLEASVLALAEAAMSVARAEAGAIYVLAADRSLLLRATAGSGEVFQQVRLQHANGLLWRAVRRGRSVCVDDVILDPRVPNGDAIAAAGYRGMAVVPLVSHGQAVGAFVVLTTRVAGIRRKALASLHRLGAQALAELDDAPARHAEGPSASLGAPRSEPLVALRDAAVAFGQCRSDADVFEVLGEQALAIAGTRHVWAASYAAVERSLEVHFWVAGGRRQSEWEGPGVACEGLGGEVTRLGETIATDDYLAECRVRGLAVAEQQIDAPGRSIAWVGVPLRVREQVFGVVCAYAPRGVALDGRAVGPLETLAYQAALALEGLRSSDHVGSTEAGASDQARARTRRQQALGELALGTAHDLNNTLALILGHADMLSALLKGKPGEELASLIGQGVEEAAASVRRLQRFGRTRAELVFQPVEVAALLRDTLDLTRPRWSPGPDGRSMPIAAELAVAADLPPILGDPGELHELLTNLVLNAVDAMQQGGRLELLASARDGGVEIQVADTGCGMSKDIASRAFEAYFTTKGEQGTGIGLTLAKEIVERHGGQIVLRTSPRRGTRVSVWLPATQPRRATRGTERAAARRKLRVLAVEDEAPLARMLELLLASAGHATTVCQGGAEAIARVKGEPDAFDVVITDLGMPEVSGWDVAKSVRDVRPTLPVVLATGWGAALAEGEQEAAGVRAVLPKPYRRDDLLAMLDQVTGAP